MLVINKPLYITNAAHLTILSIITSYIHTKLIFSIGLLLQILIWAIFFLSSGEYTFANRLLLVSIAPLKHTRSYSIMQTNKVTCVKRLLVRCEMHFSTIITTNNRLTKFPYFGHFNKYRTSVVIIIYIHNPAERTTR